MGLRRQDDVIFLVCILLSYLFCGAFSQNLTQSIYSSSTGALGGTFQNWSWATVNLKDTTVVRSGTTYSVSVVVEGYKAAYFHGDFYMGTSSLQTLSFWVNGGTQGGQQVSVLIIGTSGSSVCSSLSLASLLGKPVPVNQWVQVVIDFTTFNCPSEYYLSGLEFQASTNNNEGTIYFGDISFVVQLPSAKPITLTVSTAQRQPVSPLIYGGNFASLDQLKAIKYPINRWGGNAVTRYNYLVDAENHAADWYFEDLPNAVADVSKLPNGSQSYTYISEALSVNAKMLLTTPTIGWRPFDRELHCGFSVKKYGAQQKTDPYQADCGNGVKTDGTYITGNDPADTSFPTGPDFNVGWIKYLDQIFGRGAVRYFQMDNEPGLWHSTHRDVHPIPLTYDELWNRTQSYGGALKTAFPDCLIFGPICWGWCSYMYSPSDGCTDGSDRKAHGDLPLIQWLIQQNANYKKTSGQQILDVIDVHFYPQAPGVSGNSEDPLTALLRLRSPRGLWDKTYTDESWISEPIYILQRINDWIASISPGELKLAVSEYNYGDYNIITAALATVETLGIFAQQNVTFATIWETPDTGSLTEDAFKLYLNYDGKASQVTGDIISSTSTDTEVVSSYAYLNDQTRTLYIVILNKASSSTVPVTTDISGISFTGQVTYYSFNAKEHIHQSGTDTVKNGIFVYQSPAWSASLAVISY